MEAKEKRMEGRKRNKERMKEEEQASNLDKNKKNKHWT